MESEYGSVQAVILAGGEGSRLRPLTKNRPKVLLPAANRPILLHLLDSVVAAGIRDIVVVTGYKSEQVLRTLASYPVQVQTVLQKKQLGVMDAVSTASRVLHADRILLLAGDNYLDTESIRRLLSEKNAILAAPSSNPSEYGVIKQKNGILTAILSQQTDAPAGTLVSCAASIMERSLHDIFLSCGGVECADNLAQYDIKVLDAGIWEDALTIPCLLRQNSTLLENSGACIQGTVDKSAVIRGRVSIGKNTFIGPNTVITGPAVIGDNCRIEASVCIGPGTSVGSQVTIEPFTYVSNAILMDGCFVGAQSRITDSVIGEGAVITQAVTISVDGFGTVVGDRANVGAFTQLKGAVIGNNAVLDGGKSISESIPDNARVM
ncbi:MAG TPA: sugar phosphate nucleotidyltransferase [Methanocorpusculum sp.]|nr:sugar phosphate nucleotidyltransferase [Methanocorpusculum sp.]